ncbi:MAG: EamA family transporter [Campylobacteraceae bacterium]|nr:EamA family transporter [Campylobacteraceae bacterium]
MEEIKQGNLFGVLAILLWSTLAALTVLTGDIPPFQLVALSFFIASFLGIFMLKKQKHSFKKLFQIPLSSWIVGICGLFGYHFFYFFALKSAPAVEANLINYLWPLLIVLFSAFLPNEKLKWFHIVGSLFGLLGAFLLVSKNGSLEFKAEYISGYIYAVIAAVIWASYSVISRKFSHIPTYSVTGFCIATAILSFICHLLFETTVIPDFTQVIAIIILGLGPVGGAFYVWDYGMKNGDIKVLGSLAYFTPLLSTFILIIFSLAVMNQTIAIACFLIILGSLISSKESLQKILSKRKAR